MSGITLEEEIFLEKNVSEGKQTTFQQSTWKLFHCVVHRLLYITKENMQNVDKFCDCWISEDAGPSAELEKRKVQWLTWDGWKICQICQRLYGVAVSISSLCQLNFARLNDTPWERSRYASLSFPVRIHYQLMLPPQSPGLSGVCLFAITIDGMYISVISLLVY